MTYKENRERCGSCIYARPTTRTIRCAKRKSSAHVYNVCSGAVSCDKFESTDGYVWSSGCEDYPCCGHSAGECPSGWRRID